MTETWAEKMGMAFLLVCFLRVLLSLGQGGAYYCCTKRAWRV